MILNVHKSIGSEERHPRVLRKLADIVAKLLVMIFEKWHLDEVPAPGKEEILYTSLKGGERKTL